MSFGFPPTKKISLALPENVTPKEAVALACEVFQELKWETTISDSGSITAWTKISIYAFGEEVQFKVDETEIRLISKTHGTQIIDWGKNKRNLKKFSKLFTEKAASIEPHDLATLVAQYDAEKTAQPRIDQAKAKNKTYLLLPTADFWATPLLFWANVIVFIVMITSGVHVLNPMIQDLIDWGGNMRMVTREGQWWRLLSNCFVHIGIIHLLANMYGLVFIGRIAEQKIGSSRMLLVYVFSGLLGSCTSYMWNENVVSAGASGAIFGLFGTFLALLFTKSFLGQRSKNLLISMGVYVAYTLSSGLTSSGVDNAAHIGGLITGLLLGFIFAPSYKTSAIPGLKIVLNTVAFAAIALTCFGFIVLTPKQGSMEKSLITYDEKMREFARLEQLGTRIFTFSEHAPAYAIKAEIRDRSIPYWKENIALVEKLEALELPDELKRKNELLLKYSKLRLNHLRLLYRAVDADSNEHKERLAKYGEQIETVLHELEQQVR